MKKYIEEIIELQNEYYDVLKLYEDSLQTTSDFRMYATLLIEDVKKFWLCKSTHLSLILDSITEPGDSVLLCEAIYLGVEDNEEYVFSTFGSHHFLNDPFLRMEPFVVDQSGDITPYAREYFLNAYNDTMLILSSLSKSLLFSPFLLLYHHQIKDHQETINHGYWGVISSLLKGEYSCPDDIKRDFKNIAAIEDHLSPESLKHLIFSEQSNSESTLMQRIDDYFQENKAMLPLHCSDEINKFIVATYAQTSQIIEILLVCLYFKVIPFIRYDITFHYLMLLSGSFSEHEEIRILIAKSIIIHLFYNNIDRRIFDSIDFVNYSTRMEDYNLLDRILSKATCNGESFFDKNVNQIVLIIKNEFDECLSQLP